MVLLAGLVSGCGPSQSELEKAIRDEMKSKMNVDITSFDLKKQSNGSYVGTATAVNGNVYDVVTEVPKLDKVEWKAIPGQVMVEKMARAEIEQLYSGSVTSLQLTKKEPGVYTSRADLMRGKQLDHVDITTHMDGLLLKPEYKLVGP